MTTTLIFGQNVYLSGKLVMAAEYTGERHEPTFSECLLGGTGSWPEGAGYAAWQKAKLPRMRLGVPDGTPLADEIDRLLKERTGL